MKTSKPLQPEENIRKLGELIQDIQFAMFTTVDRDGSLHSRPMAAGELESEGDLWFFSSRSSGKIKSIEKDQHVNVAFSSPENHKYVSVSGRAELISDRQKMKSLWKSMFKTWFPQGLEDPNLILIRVRVESAEYWDSPSKLIVRLANFKNSILGGAHSSTGDHQRVNLSH